jgi:hypothetical protein
MSILLHIIPFPGFHDYDIIYGHNVTAVMQAHVMCK